MPRDATIALALLAALTVARAAPSEDEVERLPGWRGPLPSRQWSGYINISDAMGADMRVHYWYIESEGSPEADPLLVWTNGGPGASSMFGLLVELGPLLLNDESVQTAEYGRTGVPTMFYNPHSWSRLGGLLMFDWPPPVGFSYCNDPTAGGFSCGEWDDERMAKASYEALAGWCEPVSQSVSLYQPLPRGIGPLVRVHHPWGDLAGRACV